MKKGQATPFIIVGIILVIGVSITVFYLKPDIVSGRISGGQIGGIDTYLEECIQNKLQDKLERLKVQGGRNELDRAGLTFRNYNILLTSTGLTHLPSKPLIQRFITEEIENFLINDGCSLDDFRRDYVINENKAEIDVKTFIGEQKVTVTVDYPITITRGDFSSELNRFSVSSTDNFGRLYTLARDVVAGAATGQVDDIGVYCGDQSDEFICSVGDNINGRQVVFIGNENDFPDREDARGDANNLFVFVITR